MAHRPGKEHTKVLAEPGVIRSDGSACAGACPAPARPMVMVVDDDPCSRQIVAAYLRAAFDIVEASSAQAALDRLGNVDVDLVILDVMMPGMNGFDACRAVKSRAREYLPVLLLTSLDGQDERNAGLLAGADDFLSKPVNRAELMLRVGSFVKIRRQEQLIRQQLEELKKLQALKEDLFSLIVHDLRNPLGSIVLDLEVMGRRARNQADIDDVLLRCTRLARRMGELLNDTLDVRLLEAGRLPVRRQPVAIHEILDQVVETLRPIADSTRVTLRVTTDEDCVVDLDPSLARRAIENMVSNAIDYTPEEEAVEILARKSEQGLVLEIADRGPGVPEEQRSSLFQKFGVVTARSHAARRSHGLGLFFVHLVVTAHGGTVGVKEREGGGSVFRLVFPAQTIA
ncbi:MAG: hybrid sensor histidine kinase/response regulator [Deltaproteobacteria bacterium]|nr:hybrid sensor histidine kinase/response regulator [Deltaproteobacteria bacterium]